MPPKKPHKGGYSGKTLTLKQKALVALMPVVESGQMTMKAAMIKAGYTENTADQQQNVLAPLRGNPAMQEALRKHGVTEELLAEKIKAGTVLPPGKAALGYVQSATELLDLNPPKRQINADVTLDDLIRNQEADSRAEK